MADDDIAIVGAGCRFPGADNLSEFWRVLVNGENHVTEIPESMWKNKAFYNADPSEPGKSYVRKAGLLQHHDKWDNRLFGISDNEASRIDPQQRCVLECVHMALEDGGITRKQIYGSNTGVIIGCMNNDYKSICNSEIKDVNSFNATGTSASILSARVSYVYNLQGTCLTLDTACSSALVAIHLAIQAIKTGDCDMVICGGVSSILSPDIFVTLCKARMLSPTGQCQSFCETADGYARGEGCGVVILKKLKTAFEDGNKVWATIKTGSNQDGSMEKPMTAPSLEQQFALLKEVYKTHKQNPDDIQYIEAHGTGTTRGDPTEVNALGKFFSTHRTRKASTEHILVGSVKTNIGHTESAAGIAGLLKILLMMKHGKYVPSLHVDSDLSNVTKSADLSNYGITIATEVVDWPFQSDGRRFACLNSFGFGGSNVHALITQQRNNIESENPQMLHGYFPVCISGLNRESLHNNLVYLQRELGENMDYLNDIAVTSFFFRDIYPYRTLLFGSSVEELREDCQRKIVSKGNILPKKDTNIVFVYCGVGTTWTGMGQELINKNEIFRKTISQIDTYLFPLTGWRIYEKFMHETMYDDPFLNHIAIFCIQVGLTEVWSSFGIVPDKIIGQSVGEVAAAYAAKFLSLEESVKIIYHRSLILSSLEDGAMAVIGNLNIDIVEDICEQLIYDMSIAVYSSPVACTVSGEIKSICELKDSINRRKENNILFKELSVKCAYHSPMIESCTGKIMKTINGIFNGNMPTTINQVTDKKNMVSTVSGMFVSASEVRNGSYWARNIRQPVLFMQAIKLANEETKTNIYLEIGPRPVLRAHLSNIFEDSSNVRAIPSMLTKNEVPCIHRSLTEIFELGKDICDVRLDKSVARRIALNPRYHFNRTGGVFIPKVTQQYFAGFTVSDNDSHLFTHKLTENEFQIMIDIVSTPFVYDHFLSGKIIVPGATYIEAALHAGTMVLKKPVNKLCVTIKFIKTFSPKADRQNKISLRTESREGTEMKFTVYQAVRSLANGVVRPIPTYVDIAFNIARLRIQCSCHISSSEFYKRLKKLNFEYGETLSLVQEAWLSESGTECLTHITIPEKYDQEMATTHFHPAVIDSIFQMFGLFQDGKKPMNKNSFLVPEGVEAITLYRPFDQAMICFAKQVNVNENSRYYNGVLMSKNGEIIARIENFKVRVVQSHKKEHNDAIQSIKINWIEMNTFSDKPITENNKIILLTDGYESNLKDAFGKYVHVVSFEIRNFLSLQSNDLDNKTTLVYHATDEVTRLDLCEKNTLTNVTNKFLDLKNVLSTLNELGTNIELTVITENTQMCHERDFIYCYGAGLWGMFRCAVHEGIYRNMKIVDIDRENISAIDLIRLIFSPSKSHVELAMSGSKTFQSKLELFKNPRFPRRQVNVDKSQSLALFSRKLTHVDDPVLVLTKEKDDQSEAIMIQVEAFTVPEKRIYSSLLINEENRFKSKEGAQILAIEGVGKVEKTKEEVIFLFPVLAENVIKIPQQCILFKADYPQYISGTLLISNMIVQLAAAIRDHAYVLLVGKPVESRDFGLKMFDYLMKSKHCKVEHLMPTSLTNIYPHQADTLVLTEYITFSHMQKIMHCMPNVRNLVSLQCLVEKHFSSWMQCNFPNIEIDVLSSIELFDKDKIGISMSTINTYISSLSRNTVKIKNKFLHKLPMKTINFHEVFLKESYKCLSYESSFFRSSASYIIVGGLTGLGWEILCLMAEMGAGILVTISRSKPSLCVQEQINQIETRHSCKILCIQADVTELESIADAFKRTQFLFPNHPIKGLFHGAGVLNDSTLFKLTEESISAVMRPKILGALNLHKLSLDLSLDYFVVQSSLVSMIGNPGQCNYAAGNSFLDSFVQFRRMKGLPAQGINWGPLTVGMVTHSETNKSHLEQKGFKSMDRENVRRIFIEAMQSDSTNIGYADIIWEKLLSLPSFVKQSSKYIEFNKFASSDQKKFKHIDTSELLKLDDEKKLVFVKEALREIMHDVLVTDSETLKDDQPLNGLGIDSMAIMGLLNVIEEVFGCRISFMMLNEDDTTLSVIAENVIQFLEKGENGDKLELEQSVNLQYEYLFESNDITFMERDVLENCFHNKGDPFFLRVLDIEMSGIKITINDWKKIIRRVLKMNPELRKRFHFSDNGDISVEEISENHPAIKIQQITKREFKMHHGEDIRLSMTEEASNILPVSFRIALSRNKTFLRIIHHAAVLDLRGLSLLCKDIAVTVPEVLLENEEPEYKKNIDIPARVRKAILPKMDELNLFWDNYLNLDITPISLGKILQDVNEKLCCLVNVDIPKSQFQTIRNYLSKMKITMYEFVMSLYQLFLYIGSHSKVVTVGSATDLRYHVPDLRHVITRCTNYIPVIANINEDLSLSEFIQTNSAKISSTTQHGAFPSSLILGKIPNDEVRRNVFRHFLAMNDLTSMNTLLNKNDYMKTKFGKMIIARPTRETFIYVRYDLQQSWMTFEMGFNSEICGKLGQMFPEMLLLLANEVIFQGNKRIATLRDEVNAKTIEKQNPFPRITSNSSYFNVDLSNEPGIMLQEPFKSIAQIKENALESCDKQLIELHRDSTPKVSCNEKDIQTFQVKERKTILEGDFWKQTKHGWDHKVHVTLDHDGQDTIIKWGKKRRVRKQYSKWLSIFDIGCVTTRKINGIPSLIVDINKRQLVFKSSDRTQVQKWMETIKSTMKIEAL